MPSHAPIEKKRAEVSKEVAKVEEGKGVPKSVKKALKKEEKVVVPTGVLGVPSHDSKKQVASEAVQQNPVARAKLVKGSAEAKAFMASIRQKKTAKDNVV
jgi:ribosomal protein L18E